MKIKLNCLFNYLYKLIIVLLFLFMINYTYSFEVFNGDMEINYFSINNPNVFIKTEQNISNFIVSYVNSNSTMNKSFNLTSCNNIYCGNFSILDLITSDNNSFSGSTKFNIFLDNESKIIYFDLEKPSLNINYIINNSELVFYFNYTDNYNVSKLNLYQIINNDSILIGDLMNKSKFIYNIDSSGEKLFQFKEYDLAGNLNEVQKQVFIPDFIKPTLDRFDIISKDNLIQLDFKISDENLSKFEISQNGIVISSDISGTSLSKTLNLPFNSGEIEFKIFDKSNNIFEKNISLVSPISNSFESIYFNQKEFVFKSNSDYCNLIYLDSSLKNLNFSKNNDEFRIYLSNIDLGEHSIEFKCKKDNYIEYFKKNFYFDNQPPSKSNLNYSLLDDGSIRLNWTESYDNQSSVIYKLYRNGDLIYSGNKLYYVDSNVIYPNLYDYKLISKDEASNKVESNILTNLVPKKVRVDFSTNIKKDQFINENPFNLTIFTEKNVIIRILVSNNDSNYYNKLFNKTSLNGVNNYKINLTPGLNKIKIIVKDNFSNIKEKEYFLTYLSKEKEIVKNEISSSVKESSNLNKIKDKINNTLNTKLNNLKDKIELKLNKKNSSAVLINSNKNNSFWNFLTNISIWWYLIILILIIIFLAFKYGRDDFILEKLNGNKKKLKHSFLDFSLKQRDDSKLGNSLEKIKRKRLERIRELEKEKRLKKIQEEKKNLSEYHKKKLEEISKRKKLDFSPVKKKEKIKIDKIELLKEKFDLINKSILASGDKLRNRLNKPKNKKEEDPFNSYLNRVKNSNSWDSSREYLERTLLEKKKKEEEKERIKLESKIKQEEERKRKEEEKRKKEELKLKKQLKKEKLKEEKRLAKESLDDYLNKKISKKRNYFAEKLVELDLKRREK